MTISRRGFVSATSSAAALGLYQSAEAQTGCPQPAAVPDTTVRLFGDGLGLTPQTYASLLDELCRDADITQDNYLLGGEVERFEQYCAALLGKEAAVFMPSGTLANQLAIRALAGSKKRVIVPEMSHVYNDTGDACQTLANLNLIPLAPNRATFTLEEVESVLTRTAGGRVATDVGAILIESPVRRLLGQTFEWQEAQRIAAFAREQGIGTHLDGARLFIGAAYSDLTPAEIAAPFDTVYVSLWKYFNSGIGAILAGPKSSLENMFHVRRMFGGNLYLGWPAALVARHYMGGFVERLKTAVHISEEFYAEIEKHPKVSITRITDGTNVARMQIINTDLEKVSRRLRERDMLLGRTNQEGVVSLGVNETWNRTTSANLVRAFEEALA
jgi:threonine aldolase